MATPRSTQPISTPPGRSATSLLANGTLRAAQLVLLLSAIGALALVRSDPSYATFAAGAAVALVALVLNAGSRRDIAVWFGYVALFIVFAHLRGIADEGGFEARFGYVIDLERAIFLGTTPTVWLQSNVGAAAPIADYLAIGTHLSYFIVPQVVAAVLLMRRHRMAFVYLAAVLVTVYAGLLVCYLVPTAPPWLASHAGMVPPVERVLDARLYQVNEGAIAQGETFAGINHVAAMPSLHVALPAVLVGLAWTAGAWRRWLATGYCALMGLSLVYLGEHYVVDIAAGVALGLAAWLAVRRLAEWRRAG